eukprot:g6797.t1
MRKRTSAAFENHVKFTRSGAYQVGDFFKINEVGFQFSPSSRSSVDEEDPEQQQRPERLEVTALADLQVLSSLGQGASGLVHRALHKPSNKVVALKVVPLDLSEEKSKRVLTELRTLHNCRSQHIVSFHGAFYKERALNLVLGYMDAGSLLDVLGVTRTVEEKYLAHITQQVLRGLRYLHKRRRVIHRDIKPSNILLNRQGTVQIADFGVSGEIGERQSEKCKMTFAGTVTYMSPERIQGKSHSFDSDIWSLGLTLAECVLGYFPYLKNQEPKDGEGSDKRPRRHKKSIGFWDILETIVSCPVPELPPGRCSDQFASFLEHCLQKEPGKRASAAQLLKHPWLTRSEEVDLAGWICSLPLPSFEQAQHASSKSTSSIDCKASDFLSPSAASATGSASSSTAASSSSSKLLAGALAPPAALPSPSFSRVSFSPVDTMHSPLEESPRSPAVLPPLFSPHSTAPPPPSPHPSALFSLPSASSPSAPSPVSIFSPSTATSALSPSPAAPPTLLFSSLSSLFLSPTSSTSSASKRCLSNEATSSPPDPRGSAPQDKQLSQRSSKVSSSSESAESSGRDRSLDNGTERTTKRRKL